MLNGSQLASMIDDDLVTFDVGRIVVGRMVIQLVVFHLQFDAETARRMVFKVIVVAAALRFRRPITTGTASAASTAATLIDRSRTVASVVLLPVRFIVLFVVVFLLLRPAGRRRRPFRRAAALFLAPSRDGVTLRVIAFASNQFWQHSPPSINEPVADLYGKITNRS